MSGSVKSPIPLAGVIPIRVSGQKAQPSWMQQALKKALEKGEGSQALQHQCRIAQDVNDSMAKSLTAPYVPNPNSKARFGRTRNGLPFLTVGITNTESAVNVQLHWEGSAVPKRMVDVAVRHDEGKSVRAATIPLDLAAGTHYVLGQKDGRLRNDPRRGHHLRKDGTPLPSATKRRHGRICQEDVERVYAAVG